MSLESPGFLLAAYGASNRYKIVIRASEPRGNRWAGGWLGTGKPSQRGLNIRHGEMIDPLHHAQP